MLHLILVRHGETGWNLERRYQGQTDVPLSDVGRRQAALVAPRLAGRAIDAAYASDLQRAWDTASIIGQALGITATPEPRLREIKFGAIEGLTFDEAEALYPAMLIHWLEGGDGAPPGGETYQAFSARVQALLDGLKQVHRDQTVLLVAHGGPIRQMIRLALGLPPAGQWYFKVENASISELSLYGEQPMLLRLNDTAHLDNGHQSPG